MSPSLASLADRINDEGASAWDIHAKARAALSRGEDVILMSVGDNDLMTDPVITDRAIQALRQGDTHYIDSHGRLKFREAVARHLSPRFGWEVDADDVTITQGTQNALFMASCLLLEPGDEVIVADPMYVTYGATLSALGAKIVRLPCPARLGFHPDIEQLEQLASDRTRAIFFASPVNPTGVVFDRNELAAIAAFAVQHDLWVVSDEVYSQLVLDGQATAMASFPGMRERCVTIESLSKSHSMTGWRAGWACGPKAFSKAAAALSLAMTYGLPGFVQEAAIVALTIDPKDLRTHYRNLLDIAMNELSALPQVAVSRPHSGMFVLLPVASTRMSSSQFVEQLYAETGVSVLDAELFGSDLKGMVRITFAMDETQLRDGLRRIVTFCKTHQQTG